MHVICVNVNRSFWRTQVLFCQNPENPGVDAEYAQHIPGLEALEKADLLILAVRFLNLPDDQMKRGIIIPGGIRSQNSGALAGLP